jgi:hypothetical protein
MSIYRTTSGRQRSGTNEIVSSNYSASNYNLPKVVVIDSNSSNLSNVSYEGNIIGDISIKIGRDLEVKGQTTIENASGNSLDLKQNLKVTGTSLLFGLTTFHNASGNNLNLKENLNVDGEITFQNASGNNLDLKENLKVTGTSLLTGLTTFQNASGNIIEIKNIKFRDLNDDITNNEIKYENGNIILLSNSIKIGSSIPLDGKYYSNLLFSTDNTFTKFETQSSAFTETLKGQIETNEDDITDLKLKTQYISTNTNLTTTSITSTLDISNHLKLSNDTASIYVGSSFIPNKQLLFLGNVTSNIQSQFTAVTNDISTLITKTQNISLLNGITNISGNVIVTDDLSVGGGTFFQNASGNELLIKNIKFRDFTSGSVTNSQIKYNDGAMTLSSPLIINTISYGLTFSRIHNDMYNSGGRIGLLENTNSDFYIVGNGINSMYINSEAGQITLNTSNRIHLQSNIVLIGSGIKNTTTNKYSNLLFFKDNGTDTEIQSSAFTETLKGQIATNKSDITDLKLKTQYISTDTNLTTTSITGTLDVSNHLKLSNDTASIYIGLSSIPNKQLLYLSNVTSNIQSQFTAVTDDVSELITKTQNISLLNGITNISGNVIVTDDLSIGGETFFQNASGNVIEIKNIKFRDFTSGEVTSSQIKHDNGTMTLSSPSIINTISYGLTFSRIHNEIYSSGGRIGLLENTNSDFYIVSNEENSMYINSGKGQMTLNTSNRINLQSNNILIGSGIKNTTTDKYSNLLFFKDNGTETEIQSSAFTETLKGQIETNKSNITDLKLKTQNISSSALLQTNISGNVVVTNDLTVSKLKFVNATFYVTTNNILTLDSPFSFSSTTAPTSNQSLLLTNNNTNSIPTCEWVQNVVTARITSIPSSGVNLNLTGTLTVAGLSTLNGNTVFQNASGNNLDLNGVDSQLWVKNIKLRHITSGLETSSQIKHDNNEMNISSNKITIDSSSDTMTLSSSSIINTISYGVIFSRIHNGIYSSGGRIGLLDTTNSDFCIFSGLTNAIFMNSGSGSTTLETSNRINLQSNIVWVGSGTANANGRKSNINMYDATGTSWETQSSAFTETLKTQLISNTNKFTDASSFYNRGKYKTAIVSNVVIGLADPLPQSKNYNNYTPTNNSNSFNASQYFSQSASLSSIFDSSGKFSSSTPMRFNVSVEMEFDTHLNTIPSGTTGVGIKVLESRLRINNSVGSEIDGTYWQGLNLSGYISSNKYVRYRLTINHIFYTGDQIILQSNYDFNTASSPSYVGARMTAMFILERQVL